MSDFVCPISGVRVPADLVGNLAPIGALVPNTWNPNKMDSVTRAKLVIAIKKDGFVIPTLVRPIAASSRPDKADLIAAGVLWEIVDGEHRWDEGSKLGMVQVPIVNVGPIDDVQAKQLTIKANALKGEFDSVQLAEMIKDLANETGIQTLVDELPYTQERLQAMVDLLSVNVDSLRIPTGPRDDDEDDDGASAGAPPTGDDFKSFDGSEMKLEHTCPRCNFQFNTPKKG